MDINIRSQTTVPYVSKIEKLTIPHCHKETVLRFLNLTKLYQQCIILRDDDLI
jgi:hypothetical protein